MLSPSLIFSGHADKHLYDILGAVDVPEKLKPRIFKADIYLASIHNEQFNLQVPTDFQPHNFKCQL